MKIIELLQRPSIAVTNEELDLLEKIKEKEFINKQDLSQREVYIVDQLINKDLVIRKIKNESIEYTVTARIQRNR